MNRHITSRQVLRNAACISLALSLASPLSVLSAPTVSLAAAPLANSTTTSVLPNLMFTLDTSGSMGFNYLPDWADDNLCKNTNGSYNLACANQPLFQSADFNGVYYNPAINYLPPVDYQGTAWASQTTWTAVKNNAFSGTANTNLVTSYVDIEWCTDNSYTDCLRNDNYILPGTVNSKAYTTMHTTTSSGTGTIVSGDATTPTTSSRTFGPHYYTMNPGEYCDSAQWTNCQASQTATFSFPAKLRWCTSAANASASSPAAGSCQKIRTGSYTVPRFPTRFYSGGTSAVAAIPASVTLTIVFDNTCNTGNPKKRVGISSIKANNISILPSATATELSSSTLRGDVTGQTANAGYAFSGSNSDLKITAPASAGAMTSSDIVITPVAGSTCTFSTTVKASTAFVAAIPAVPASFYGSFTRTDIVSGNTYPKAAGRTDCAGTTCTYTEEMTNFANWWTYYQTRMQTMKTAVSRAFKPIDSRYRVGFIDIYGTSYLPITTFTSGSGNAKNLWYTKLFGATPSNGTPLRSALSRVGRIFAGKKPVGTSDPMQYSCQQNFVLLTTDGYWNTDADTDVLDINGATIGDMDGGSTARPKYEGPTASSATLADVAKYYYDTDLRDTSLNNCTGSLGVDVCENNVFVSNTDNNTKQHMTTFTLGLGVDGTITYQSDYKTAAPGDDFYKLANGTGTPVLNWPVPVADTETAVDDLWHAAVNGNGTYFSAKDPTQLSSGLNSALASIQAKAGAGAAAATSTLNPVAGDNGAFLATYTTVKWQGNLEKRLIDTHTGDISDAATWCIEDVVPGVCPAPGTIVPTTSGSATTYACVTPGQADTELAVACTGTMASKVSAASDSRTIKMKSSTGTLVDFTYANMSSTQKAYFVGSNLSQWSVLDSTTQQPNANGTNMVAYLRGQSGYDMRGSNPAANRVFRQRDAVTGDFTESQPVFIGKPVFSYTDAGYSTFVTAQSGRGKSVYIGGNDGMLHAYNADDGTERWAYVPSMVIPNMWKLADANYASNHTNFVNGAPIVSDVYSGGAWHTILVGGLNGGGRGYYALDVTNPASPTLLWEIDSTTDNDIGYSYGQPVITKLANGTWVVLLTSGYNNTSPGSGDGILFVRNAYTGASISKIATGGGTSVSPSGLAKISAWGDDPEKNNLATYTYGGDLNGNVWRFDINAATAMKFATLQDSTGNAQPVTAAPSLGSINGKRIIYIGTGKYLELSDLTDTHVQSIYAIKDDNATTTLVNPRTTLVQQTLTTTGTSRKASSNAVDFNTGRGWFIDLPDSGERININPLLVFGNLYIPSTVPSNTVCSPGGYSWFNFFDYRSGNNGANVPTSTKINSTIVGDGLVITDGGGNGGGSSNTVKIEGVTSNGQTLILGTSPLPAKGYQGQRVIWRELVP